MSRVGCSAKISTVSDFVVRYAEFNTATEVTNVVPVGKISAIFRQ